ncbi:MAG: nucleotidyltransferase family protein [Terriglobales bacterium]
MILAAGAPGALPFPQALGRFGRQTAIGIAVRNAARIGPPLVVLGAQAALVRPAVPRRARVVLNRAWRAGQIASLRAGLRRVPPGMALMLYPVDFPLLTERLLLRLVRVYEQRKPGKLIVAPQFRGRGGHPVIFAPELRAELASALSLREVVYRDPARVQYVPERTAAIRADFDTMSAYRLRRRQFRAR